MTPPDPQFHDTAAEVRRRLEHRDEEYRRLIGEGRHDQARFVAESAELLREWLARHGL